METLFGCNSAVSIPKEATRKSVLPPVEQENRVLDPKKSQNIAILLRALNVTRDEVSEALLDGMYPKPCVKHGKTPASLSEVQYPFHSSYSSMIRSRMILVA